MPSPPPPVRPPRDLPPLGEVSIRFVLTGTEDEENDEDEEIGIGWDEADVKDVDVKEGVGFEIEDDDTKEDGEDTNLVLGEETNLVFGEDTNLVLEEEEEEMGNEENVFVTSGADDDTMAGDRKDEVGKDGDCENVVVRVREDGDESEVAGDRLAKNLAPQRGDTDSPATARRVTKESLILPDLRVQSICESICAVT